MEELIGKALIRRSTSNGKPVVIVCGVFHPNQPIENFDDRDEMWAVKFLVADVLKFVGNSGGNGEYTGNLSPEDFLENVDSIQDVRCWKKK